VYFYSRYFNIICVKVKISICIKAVKDQYNQYIMPIECLTSQKGFTLIEFIIVIVMLGILASTALPKFITIGQEARVTAVNSLTGAIKSTANLWYGICLIKEAQCKAATWPSTFSYQGKSITISNLYPEAGDNINGNQIDTLINTSGFTVSLTDNLTTQFSLSTATDPSNCSVSYKQATSLTTPPVFTSITTGC
jgi:MSHA pilin protein MshA